MGRAPSELRRMLVPVATTLLLVVVLGLATPAPASTLPAGPDLGPEAAAGPTTPPHDPATSVSPGNAASSAHCYDDAQVSARGDGPRVFSGSFSGFSATNAPAGSVRDINPLGGRNNCVNCAIATDARLAGSPASALDVAPGVCGQPISILEDAYGASFKPVAGRAEIEAIIGEAGSGSRGIVFGSRGADTPGHVFNVVNQNGSIRFLDGQSGGVASLEGFEAFHLLRTG